MEKDDKFDKSQEYDMDSIEGPPETNLCRSGKLNNPISRIVPSFSGNKYENTTTTDNNGLKFTYPIVNP